MQVYFYLYSNNILILGDEGTIKSSHSRYHSLASFSLSLSLKRRAQGNRPHENMDKSVRDRLLCADVIGVPSDWLC